MLCLVAEQLAIPKFSNIVFTIIFYYGPLTESFRNSHSSPYAALSYSPYAVCITCWIFIVAYISIIIWISSTYGGGNLHTRKSKYKYCICFGKHIILVCVSFYKNYHHIHVNVPCSGLDYLKFTSQTGYFKITFLMFLFAK